MTVQRVQSFVEGTWVEPGSAARSIESAVTGDVIAEAGHGCLDMGAVLGFATERGGPWLRAMTFHERAKMLKAPALLIKERKAALTSFPTTLAQQSRMR